MFDTVHIDKTVTLLTQTKGNCSQTCLAMLSKRSIAEVSAIMHVEEGSYANEIFLTCKLLGIPIIGDWVYDFDIDDIPVNCLLSVEQKHSDSRHLIVRVGNTYLDPHGIEYYHLPRMYKTVKFLAFETELVWVDRGPDGYSRGGSVVDCSRRRQQ